jgi:hypothetical protein
MSLQTIAIGLSVAGGLAELAGLGMVIREIGSDRKRARELLGRKRQHQLPRRKYGPKLPVPGRTSTPGERGHYFDKPDVFDIRRQAGRGIATLANHMIDMRKAIDKERDDLEIKLLQEIDAGDDELRQRFREVLESDLTERWIGVIALATGIVLSATGSVLSSLG